MKKNSHLVILMMMLFADVTVNAQSTFQKSIGGSASDYAANLSPTADNGFILVGTTSSFGAGGADIYLIKLNADGDTLWTRTYGGANDEYGSSVTQTSDGGYIISGNTKSFGVAGKDAYLIKTDMNGNVLWSKTYGSTGNDYGNKVLQTTDGGYIVAGTTESVGNGNYNVYLIKTNSDGDTLWTKSYGGSLEDDGNFIQQTSDGGFILVGTTFSFGSGGYDIYVIKTNESGDTTWTKTYGGTIDDYGFSVKQIAGGDYLVTGTTNSFGAGSFDCYLMQLNPIGGVVWIKTYGGTGWDNGYSILQTTDNGFLVLGQSFSFGIASDIYLIKTDEVGDTLWTRTYGGSGYEFESCILQTTDGGYLISAGEESFGPDRNIYLIKTDAGGNSGCFQASSQTIVNTISIPVTSTSTTISAGGTVASQNTIKGGGAVVTTLCSTVTVNETASKNAAMVFPNPFTNEFILTGTKSDGEFKVFDLSGKEILRGQTNSVETKINTELLLPGFYLLRYNDENKTVNIKLAKF